jgi:Protein of unknown function (DUF2034)
MHLTPRVHHSSHRLLSTVQRGTAFEYRALALLTKHLSMSLTRVGGSYDGGIDLIGWWWVPSATNPATCAYRVMFLSPPPLKSYPHRVASRASRASNPPAPLDHDATTTAEPPSLGYRNTANRRRLRVLAQCKAEKRKMGPAYLRELEGVVYKHASTASTLAAPDWSLPRQRLAKNLGSSSDTQLHPTTAATATSTSAEDPPVVALLASESAFTRNCFLAAHASPLPFLLVHLPPSSTSSSSDGAGASLGTVFGNPALVSASGVLRGELEIRWERGERGPVAAVPPSGLVDGSGRPGLWWQGQPLPSWTPDAETDGAVLDRRR